MSLVVTCTMCGLVNDGKAKTCVQCGSKLSNLRFYRPHLEPGMREEISRIKPSLRVMRRPPGREVRTPEGELLYIRRAWGKELDDRPEPDIGDAEDAAIDIAMDLGFWERSAGIVGLLLYPVLLVLGLLASGLRLLDNAGRMLFDVVGHVVFRRPWIIQICGGNPPQVQRTFRARGYGRSARVIEELTLAYQVGDIEFVPEQVLLP
ncbi:MAG: hypothetical protein ACE5MI_09780 [Acidimicrobiia bacterium]